MNCPSCQTANPVGANFCSNCGTRLAVTCPRCGHAASPDARFCSNCGFALAPDATQPAALTSPAPAPAPTPAAAEPAASKLQQYIPAELLRKLQGRGGTVSVMAEAERAVGELEHAVERADAMGMRPLAWQARGLLARALDGLGQAAEAEQQRASARATVATLASGLSQPEQRSAFEQRAAEALETVAAAGR